MKDQSVLIGVIRVYFFDLWPCRRPGTQLQHGINKYISDNKVVHQPAAMDKKLNTDFTEDTDLTFSLIYFLNLYSLDLFVDFRGFASACGTPFFLKSIR